MKKTKKPTKTKTPKRKKLTAATLARLKKLIASAKHTQKEVASRCNVSMRTVARYASTDLQ